jgi:hypothetical protein
MGYGETGKNGSAVWQNWNERQYRRGKKENALYKKMNGQNER